jgi:hypothetical protein
MDRRRLISSCLVLASRCSDKADSLNLHTTCFQGFWKHSWIRVDDFPSDPMSIVLDFLGESHLVFFIDAFPMLRERAQAKSRVMLMHVVTLKRVFAKKYTGSAAQSEVYSTI